MVMVDKGLNFQPLCVWARARHTRQRVTKTAGQTNDSVDSKMPADD